MRCCGILCNIGNNMVNYCTQCIFVEVRTTFNSYNVTIYVLFRVFCTPLVASTYKPKRAAQFKIPKLRFYCKDYNLFSFYVYSFIENILTNMCDMKSFQKQKVDTCGLRVSGEPAHLEVLFYSVSIQFFNWFWVFQQQFWINL